MKEDDVVFVSSDSEEEGETQWNRKSKNKQYQLLLEKIKPILYYQTLPGHKPSTSFPYERFQELANDLTKSLTLVNVKSTKAFIWKNIIRWLVSMKLCFESVSDIFNDKHYNLILTDYMAQYVNYKCQLHSCVTDETELSCIVDRIVVTLGSVFSGWVPGILMTLLKIKVIDEYRLILFPIFKKYLSNKQLHETNDLISYLRLILCFRQWKKLVHLKTEKEMINEIAVGKSMRTLQSEVIDLDSDPKAIEPVLPIVVPPLTKSNRAFANITGLIRFASKNQNFGTRILLINKTLELEDTIEEFFRQYKEYIDQSCITKLSEWSRGQLQPILIEDLTRSSSPDQLVFGTTSATQPELHFNKTNNNSSSSSKNKEKQGTIAVNQHPSNDCDKPSLSIDNMFDELNLSSSNNETLSPSVKNNSSDLGLSLMTNNVVELDDTDDEDEDEDDITNKENANPTENPINSFEKQFVDSLKKLKERAISVGDLVNRVSIVIRDSPVVALGSSSTITSDGSNTQEVHISGVGNVQSVESTRDVSTPSSYQTPGQPLSSISSSACTTTPSSQSPDKSPNILPSSTITSSSATSRLKDVQNHSDVIDEEQPTCSRYMGSHATARVLSNFEPTAEKSKECSLSNKPIATCSRYIQKADNITVNRKITPATDASTVLTDKASENDVSCLIEDSQVKHGPDKYPEKLDERQVSLKKPEQPNDQCKDTKTPPVLHQLAQIGGVSNFCNLNIEVNESLKKEQIRPTKTSNSDEIITKSNKEKSKLGDKTSFDENSNNEQISLKNDKEKSNANESKSSNNSKENIKVETQTQLDEFTQQQNNSNDNVSLEPKLIEARMGMMDNNSKTENTNSITIDSAELENLLNSSALTCEEVDEPYEDDIESPAYEPIGIIKNEQISTKSTENISEEKTDQNNDVGASFGGIKASDICRETACGDHQYAAVKSHKVDLNKFENVHQPDPFIEVKIEHESVTTPQVLSNEDAGSNTSQMSNSFNIVNILDEMLENNAELNEENILNMEPFFDCQDKSKYLEMELQIDQVQMLTKTMELSENNERNILSIDKNENKLLNIEDIINSDHDYVAVLKVPDNSRNCTENTFERNANIPVLHSTFDNLNSNDFRPVVTASLIESLIDHSSNDGLNLNLKILDGERKTFECNYDEIDIQSVNQGFVEEAFISGKSPDDCKRQSEDMSIEKEDVDSTVSINPQKKFTEKEKNHSAGNSSGTQILDHENRSHSCEPQVKIPTKQMPCINENQPVASLTSSGVIVATSVEAGEKLFANKDHDTGNIIKESALEKCPLEENNKGNKGNSNIETIISVSQERIIKQEDELINDEKQDSISSPVQKLLNETLEIPTTKREAEGLDKTMDVQAANVEEINRKQVNESKDLSNISKTTFPQLEKDLPTVFADEKCQSISPLNTKSVKDSSLQNLVANKQSNTLLSDSRVSSREKLSFLPIDNEYPAKADKSIVIELDSSFISSLPTILNGVLPNENNQEISVQNKAHLVELNEENDTNRKKHCKQLKKKRKSAHKKKKSSKKGDERDSKKTKKERKPKEYISYSNVEKPAKNKDKTVAVTLPVDLVSKNYVSSIESLDNTQQKLMNSIRSSKKVSELSTKHELANLNTSVNEQAKSEKIPVKEDKNIDIEREVSKVEAIALPVENNENIQDKLSQQPTAARATKIKATKTDKTVKPEASKAAFPIGSAEHLPDKLSEETTASRVTDKPAEPEENEEKEKQIATVETNPGVWLNDVFKVSDKLCEEPTAARVTKRKAAKTDKPAEPEENEENEKQIATVETNPGVWLNDVFKVSDKLCEEPTAARATKIKATKTDKTVKPEASKAAFPIGSAEHVPGKLSKETTTSRVTDKPAEPEENEEKEKQIATVETNPGVWLNDVFKVSDKLCEEPTAARVTKRKAAKTDKPAEPEENEENEKQIATVETNPGVWLNDVFKVSDKLCEEPTAARVTKRKAAKTDKPAEPEENEENEKQIATVETNPGVWLNDVFKVSDKLCEEPTAASVTKINATKTDKTVKPQASKAAFPIGSAENVPGKLSEETTAPRVTKRKANKTDKPAEPEENEENEKQIATVETNPGVWLNDVFKVSDKLCEEPTAARVTKINATKTDKTVKPEASKAAFPIGSAEHVPGKLSEETTTSRVTDKPAEPEENEEKEKQIATVETNSGVWLNDVFKVSDKLCEEPTAARVTKRKAAKTDKPAKPEENEEKEKQIATVETNPGVWLNDVFKVSDKLCEEPTAARVTKINATKTDKTVKPEASKAAFPIGSAEHVPGKLSEETTTSRVTDKPAEPEENEEKEKQIATVETNPGVWLNDVFKVSDKLCEEPTAASVTKINATKTDKTVKPEASKAAFPIGSAEHVPGKLSEETTAPRVTKRKANKTDKPAEPEENEEKEKQIATVETNPGVWLNDVFKVSDKLSEETNVARVTKRKAAKTDKPAKPEEMIPKEVEQIATIETNPEECLKDASKAACPIGNAENVPDKLCEEPTAARVTKRKADKTDKTAKPEEMVPKEVEQIATVETNPGVCLNDVFKVSDKLSEESTAAKVTERKAAKTNKPAEPEVVVLEEAYKIENVPQKLPEHLFVKCLIESKVDKVDKTANPEEMVAEAKNYIFQSEAMYQNNILPETSPVSTASPVENDNIQEDTFSKQLNGVKVTESEAVKQDKLIKDRNQQVYSQITMEKFKNNIELDSESRTAKNLKIIECNSKEEDESNLSTWSTQVTFGDPEIGNRSPTDSFVEDEEVSVLTSQSNNLSYSIYHDENGTPVLDEKDSTELESPSTSQVKIISLSAIKVPTADDILQIKSADTFFDPTATAVLPEVSNSNLIKFIYDIPKDNQTNVESNFLTPKVVRPSVDKKKQEVYEARLVNSEPIKVQLKRRISQCAENYDEMDWNSPSKPVKPTTDNIQKQSNSMNQLNESSEVSSKTFEKVPEPLLNESGSLNLIKSSEDQNLEFWRKKKGLSKTNPTTVQLTSTPCENERNLSQPYENTSGNKKIQRKQKNPLRFEDQCKQSCFLMYHKNEMHIQNTSQTMGPTPLNREELTVAEILTSFKSPKPNATKEKSTGKTLKNQNQIQLTRLTRSSSQKLDKLPNVISPSPAQVSKNVETVSESISSPSLNVSSDSDDTGKLVIDFDAKTNGKQKGRKRNRGKSTSFFKKNKKTLINKVAKKKSYSNIIFQLTPEVDMFMIDAPNAQKTPNEDLTFTPKKPRGRRSCRKLFNGQVLLSETSQAAKATKVYSKSFLEGIYPVDISQSNKQKLPFGIDAILDNTVDPLAEGHNMSLESWIKNLSLRKTSKSLDIEAKQSSKSVTIFKKAPSESFLLQTLKPSSSINMQQLSLADVDFSKIKEELHRPIDKIEKESSLKTQLAEEKVSNEIEPILMEQIVTKQLIETPQIKDCKIKESSKQSIKNEKKTFECTDTKLVASQMKDKKVKKSKEILNAEEQPNTEGKHTLPENTACPKEKKKKHKKNEKKLLLAKPNTKAMELSENTNVPPKGSQTLQKPLIIEIEQDSKHSTVFPNYDNDSGKNTSNKSIAASAELEVKAFPEKSIISKKRPCTADQVLEDNSRSKTESKPKKKKTVRWHPGIEETTNQQLKKNENKQKKRSSAKEKHPKNLKATKTFSKVLTHKHEDLLENMQRTAQDPTTIVESIEDKSIELNNHLANVIPENISIPKRVLKVSLKRLNPMSFEGGTTNLQQKSKKLRGNDKTPATETPKVNEILNYAKKEQEIHKNDKPVMQVRRLSIKESNIKMTINVLNSESQQSKKHSDNFKKSLPPTLKNARFEESKHSETPSKLTDQFVLKTSNEKVSLPEIISEKMPLVEASVNDDQQNNTIEEDKSEKTKKQVIVKQVTPKVGLKKSDVTIDDKILDRGKDSKDLNPSKNLSSLDTLLASQTTLPLVIGEPVDCKDKIESATDTEKQLKTIAKSVNKEVKNGQVRSKVIESNDSTSVKRLKESHATKDEEVLKKGTRDSKDHILRENLNLLETVLSSQITLPAVIVEPVDCNNKIESAKDTEEHLKPIAKSVNKRTKKPITKQVRSEDWESNDSTSVETLKESPATIDEEALNKGAVSKHLNLQTTLSLIIAEPADRKNEIQSANDTEEEFKRIARNVNKQAKKPTGQKLRSKVGESNGKVAAFVESFKQSDVTMGENVLENGRDSKDLNPKQNQNSFEAVLDSSTSISVTIAQPVNKIQIVKDTEEQLTTTARNNNKSGKEGTTSQSIEILKESKVATNEEVTDVGKDSNDINPKQNPNLFETVLASQTTLSLIAPEAVEPADEIQSAKDTEEQLKTIARNVPKQAEKVNVKQVTFKVGELSDKISTKESKDLPIGEEIFDKDTCSKAVKSMENLSLDETVLASQNTLSLDSAASKNKIDLNIYPTKLHSTVDVNFEECQTKLSGNNNFGEFKSNPGKIQTEEKIQSDNIDLCEPLNDASKTTALDKIMKNEQNNEDKTDFIISTPTKKDDEVGRILDISIFNIMRNKLTQNNCDSPCLDEKQSSSKISNILLSEVGEPIRTETLSNVPRSQENQVITVGKSLFENISESVFDANGDIISNTTLLPIVLKNEEFVVESSQTAKDDVVTQAESKKSSNSVIVEGYGSKNSTTTTNSASALELQSLLYPWDIDNQRHPSAITEQINKDDKTTVHERGDCMISGNANGKEEDEWNLTKYSSYSTQTIKYESSNDDFDDIFKDLQVDEGAAVATVPEQNISKFNYSKPIISYDLLGNDILCTQPPEVLVDGDEPTGSISIAEFKSDGVDANKDILTLPFSTKISSSDKENVDEIFKTANDTDKSAVNVPLIIENTPKVNLPAGAVEKSVQETSNQSNNLNKKEADKNKNKKQKPSKPPSKAPSPKEGQTSSFMIKTVCPKPPKNWRKINPHVGKSHDTQEESAKINQAARLNDSGQPNRTTGCIKEASLSKDELFDLLKQEAPVKSKPHLKRSASVNNDSLPEEPKRQKMEEVENPLLMVNISMPPISPSCSPQAFNTSQQIDKTTKCLSLGTNVISPPKNLVKCETQSRMDNTNETFCFKKGPRQSRVPKRTNLSEEIGETQKRNKLYSPQKSAKDCDLTLLGSNTLSTDAKDNSRTQNFISIPSRVQSFSSRAIANPALSSQPSVSVHSHKPNVELFDLLKHESPAKIDSLLDEAKPQKIEKVETPPLVANELSTPFKSTPSFSPQTLNLSPKIDKTAKCLSLDINVSSSSKELVKPSNETQMRMDNKDETFCPKKVSEQSRILKKPRVSEEIVETQTKKLLLPQKSTLVCDPPILSSNSLSSSVKNQPTQINLDSKDQKCTTMPSEAQSSFSRPIVSVHSQKRDIEPFEKFSSNQFLKSSTPTSTLISPPPSSNSSRSVSTPSYTPKSTPSSTPKSSSTPRSGSTVSIPSSLSANLAQTQAEVNRLEDKLSKLSKNALTYPKHREFKSLSEKLAQKLEVLNDLKKKERQQSKSLSERQPINGDHYNRPNSQQLNDRKREHSDTKCQGVKFKSQSERQFLDGSTSRKIPHPIRLGPSYKNKFSELEELVDADRNDHAYTNRNLMSLQPFDPTPATTEKIIADLSGSKS